MHVIPSTANVANATNPFFDYAQRHAFAMFPCQNGGKNAIIKWKSGSTFDRAQWDYWQSNHNNLAIDCTKSEILMSTSTLRKWIAM